MKFCKIYLKLVVKNCPNLDFVDIVDIFAIKFILYILIYLINNPVLLMKYGLFHEKLI
jgi:hypothetical protein